MRLANNVIKLWGGFAAIVALALVGLFIITKLVLKSEAAEAEARRVAALSANLRVALWRLDTAGCIWLSGSTLAISFAC